ncbi:MAG: hypothetical protein ACK4UO_00410 [Pseudolabrys sp.]
MIPCARFAQFILTRDASFVTLAGVTLMVGFSFAPALACAIGATIALLFALLLIARSHLLTEERFRRSEAWRALTPQERPAGEHGLHLAQAAMRELMLRFAKNAAALAIALYAAALVADIATAPGHDTFVTAALSGTALE